MMQQLRATTQRANAAVTRVVDAASVLIDGALGNIATTGATFAWISMPCVPVPANRTHGKRYERRLQEMLT